MLMPWAFVGMQAVFGNGIQPIYPGDHTSLEWAYIAPGAVLLLFNCAFSLAFCTGCRRMWRVLYYGRAKSVSTRNSLCLLVCIAQYC
jgi:hypothetical protein